ncbi:MAG: hypothetical protein RLZZ373_2962 [Pseudomonadota bacterium]|jgi:hypothetical protein
MAITFVGSSLVAGVADEVTPAEPDGAAENDILFYWIAWIRAGASFVGPTGGWTLLNYFDNTDGVVDGRLYWIRRGASPPGFAAGANNTAYTEATVSCFSGCATDGSPIDVAAYSAVSTVSSTPDCPAVVTTEANTLVVAFGMGASGHATGTWTMPSGYSVVEDGTQILPATNITCVGSKAVVAAGSENPGAFSNAASGLDESFGGTVALREASSGTLASINGLAVADIASVNGVDVADLASFNGLTF